MFAANRDGNDNGSESSASQLQSFEFSEIKSATKDFAPSLDIGSGAFGSVYLGTMIIQGKRVFVAIKRSNPGSRRSEHGNIQFRAEVETLPMLDHPHIVHLIGYCDQYGEQILVYQYVNNGTVFDHLHKRHTRLPFLLRLLIAIRAGKGLCYLHNNPIPNSFVIHGDFKSSNVLLHGWELKISDFGLSKTCPINEDHTFVSTEYIAGTFGRTDPRYIETRQLRRSTDVYAFGVLLLELLSRMPVLGEDRYGEGMNLVKWARKHIKKGNLKPITDPVIWAEISTMCLKEYISIAESCLHEKLECRPTMTEAVFRLESILDLQMEVNSSSSLVGGTTFYDKMVDMLPFSSKRRIAVISNQNLEEYRFNDLRKATEEFGINSLLGEGSFGKVFKGWVDKNTPSSTEQGVRIPVAVKIFKQNSSSQGIGPDHWQAEVNFYGNMVHSNIISLLGYSRDKSKHLLVYEYMPNKSVYHLLFPDAPDTTGSLTLSNRLKIMLGVARGLKHLHSAEYIHFNLHSQNILVPENFDAKLGGLSVAKRCPGGEESHGTKRHSGPMAFADPEYERTGVVTKKSDVYCFGKVFLECLTGRHAFYFSDKIQLWVEDFKTGKINANNMMDQRLNVECVIKVTNCFELAFRCVADKPGDRPFMEEVCLGLERLLERL